MKKTLAFWGNVFYNQCNSKEWFGHKEYRVCGMEPSDRLPVVEKTGGSAMGTLIVMALNYFGIQL